MNNFQRLALMLVIALLVVACSGGNSPESEAGSSSGASASGGYAFMGVDELDAFLKTNSDKPTMALFWTTWCPSCKKQIPELEALRKSHGGKVDVIAISLDENVKALDGFFSKKQVDLPIYHGDDAIARKFQVSAIPTLVMFDRDGKSVFNQAGVFPHKMLEGMADKLAGE